MNYYLFATYLFVLVLVLVIVCKYFFADVKRQRRMLDEKEKQLLDTFRTLEDAMDDYYALVEDTKDELEAKGRELENRLLLPAAEQPQLPKPAEAPQKLVAKKPAKPVSQKPVPEPRNENRMRFEQMFTAAVASASEKSQLHDKIIEMSKNGRSRAEIAKELKITQTEVELVTGINRDANAAAPEETSENG